MYDYCYQATYLCCVSLQMLNFLLFWEYDPLAVKLKPTLPVGSIQDSHIAEFDTYSPLFVRKK